MIMTRHVVTASKARQLGTIESRSVELIQITHDPDVFEDIDEYPISLLYATGIW